MDGQRRLQTARHRPAHHWPDHRRRPPAARAASWRKGWHIVGGTKYGCLKAAAKRIGVPFAEYQAKIAAGLKWCTSCRAWHELGTFGVDSDRGSGLAATCLDSRRVVQRRMKFQPKHGWLKPARENDKQQARRRVNYLVEQGIIPRPGDLPCMDCGDGVFSETYRHEYDHYLGYSGAHQLDVEPVCAKCHRNREETRRGEAA